MIANAAELHCNWRANLSAGHLGKLFRTLRVCGRLIPSVVAGTKLIEPIELQCSAARGVLPRRPEVNQLTPRAGAPARGQDRPTATATATSQLSPTMKSYQKARKPRRRFVISDHPRRCGRRSIVVALSASRFAQHGHKEECESSDGWYQH
jgi:hypothetical protein